MESLAARRREQKGTVDYYDIETLPSSRYLHYYIDQAVAMLHIRPMVCSRLIGLEMYETVESPAAVRARQEELLSPYF